MKLVGYVLTDIVFEMGTGKTCTAITAIEQLRYEKNSNINGAIVCAKGTGLLNNFSQELLFACTDGRYIPDDYDKLSDLERIHRTRKITAAFYRFNTFETFAKEIAKMPDETLAQRYNNTIFVIDEVHNLREKDEVVRKADDVRNFLVNKRAAGLSEPLDIYKQFHRLFHVVKESKILLMSGTVMKSDTLLFYIDIDIKISQSIVLQKNSTTYIGAYSTTPRRNHQLPALSNPRPNSYSLSTLYCQICLVGESHLSGVTILTDNS